MYVAKCEGLGIILECETFKTMYYACLRELKSGYALNWDCSDDPNRMYFFPVRDENLHPIAVIAYDAQGIAIIRYSDGKMLFKGHVFDAL